MDGSRAHCSIDPHIHSVFLWVTDLNRAVERYAKLLGLEVRGQDRYDHLHVFRLDNGSEMILDSNGMEDVPVPDKGPVLFKLSTYDIDQAAKEAQEIGFDVIPAKRFAKLTVRGNRTHMEEAYGSLFSWFEHGPYERDVRDGSFGYEMNRLQPVNPFEVPADDIDNFDYDIYAVIMDEAAFKASDRFPGIIHVEVCHGRPRRMIGMETHIDQQKNKAAYVIPKFWADVMSRMNEIADRKAPLATIGLYQYEPPFGPQQNFRYIAGVEVEAESQAVVPEGMMEVTIPGDDCVVVTYRGNAAGFGQVWDYFHGFWFPQQNEYDAVDDYEFERHDERFLGTDDANSVFEMHFPIRRRLAACRLTDKIVVDEKGGHVLQDLRGENIRMVSFQDARLHGIDSRDAKLTHVNFARANWQHVYFSNVHVDEIQMGGTIFEHIRRPVAAESRLEGEPGTDGWINVEPVIFRDSDLSTARFEAVI